MREGRSLVDVWSLGERRHSSSEISRVVRLVVASKRWWPARVGRRLIKVPELVGTSERWVVGTSGREKASMLVGRPVEASGRGKASMLVGRLVEASGLLKVSSMMGAASLHLRRGRSSRLNGWELLLLLLLRLSYLRRD